MFLRAPGPKGDEAERFTQLDCSRHCLHRLSVSKSLIWESDRELEELGTRIDERVKIFEERLEGRALGHERRMPTSLSQFEWPRFARVPKLVGESDHLLDERKQTAGRLECFSVIRPERCKVAATHFLLNAASLYEHILQFGNRRDRREAFCRRHLRANVDKIPA